MRCSKRIPFYCLYVFWCNVDKDFHCPPLGCEGLLRSQVRVAFVVLSDPYEKKSNNNKYLNHRAVPGCSDSKPPQTLTGTPRRFIRSDGWDLSTPIPGRLCEFPKLSFIEHKPNNFESNRKNNKDGITATILLDEIFIQFENPPICKYRLVKVSRMYITLR